VIAVGLGEQLAERRGGGGLVRAGLLEAPRPAGDRIDSGVDVHSEGPARELLDVASGGGHGSAITRNADIRSTAVVVHVRIMLSSWEPPIGIEPIGSVTCTKALPGLELVSPDPSTCAPCWRI
jgi:hypothetical protein